MGDPETQTSYYDIMPNAFFTAANTSFYPGRKYTVSATVYAGTTDQGQQFADMCDTAQPRTGVPG